MTPFEVAPACLGRRALLLGAAGLAALAGCGRGEPAPASPGVAAPGEAAPPGALIAASDVPVGGGAVIRDSTLVVQPTAGTFEAYQASCPHQGMTVEPPAPGATVMVCPGHGSQFSVADGGLVRGPATRGLEPVPVTVRDGYVFQA